MDSMLIQSCGGQGSEPDEIFHRFFEIIEL
jgi:hypothetical protein